MTVRCRSRRTASTSCSRPIAARTGSATRRKAKCSPSTSRRRSSRSSPRATVRTTRPWCRPTAGSIAYLGFDDRLQGYQVTHLYVMDIDGKNSRVVTAQFRPRRGGIRAGRPTAAASTSPMTNAACESLALVSLDGKVRTLADGLGGTDLGRPYTSGSFSVARNGRVAFTHNTPARPADVATAHGGWRRARAHGAQRRPARQQDAGRGAGTHLEVLEGPARDPGLGDHAAGLRSGEEVPADPRDPRRAVRRLRA